ncbi:2-oxoglutarate-Fe(II)-dependent oxygenase superfamily protein [Acinetobacter calcoaceticus]|uniref:2-oxoglutarate-Fe(II)-dependent oxygenase superfamily protein n=1 Tax=Acinetobacter calcoaceticus TaxID=471 RepID=A0A4R1XXJ3_ACICA|nr:2-oxoglutarate-Fe(II)-dependent oxygenase superfamily protein [Acinetobacter calcoaceticus]
MPYVENAFIVIVGEILELASNGYLHGNIHRVNTPQTGLDRYSVAFFLTPNIFAGDIPLLNLKPALAELALGPDYDPLNPLYSNVGLNSLKGRLRSHPDVTERHYPQEYVQLKESKQSRADVAHA